jgi:anti-sigma factor RsiW
MSWNCVATEERLIDYLDGLLAVDERAAFEAHTKSCANCRALVSGVCGLVDGMHGLEMLEPPQGLVYRILAETTRKKAKPARKPGLSLFPAFLQPKLALGALSVIATFGILFQATGINLRKISSSDLNPMNVLRATNRQAHLTYARGVKFVSDLRVVYEIQNQMSRMQGAPAPAPAPAGPRRDNSNRAPSPESERQLKNYYEPARENMLTAGILCTLPAGVGGGHIR